MAMIVNLLSGLTSLTCAALLLRGYARSGARLLLWSGLCFACFALASLLLMIDMRTPEHDLSLVRQLPSLAGVLMLLYGLIWESGR